jgi:hypothetical protein
MSSGFGELRMRVASLPVRPSHAIMPYVSAPRAQCLLSKIDSLFDSHGPYLPGARGCREGQWERCRG